MNENKGTGSAEQDFLKEIKTDSKIADSIFDTPSTTNSEKKEETEEKNERPHRDNRETRRLRQQLEAEQKSNIALNERLKVLSELRNESSKSEGVDPRLVQLFGTEDTGKAATKLFSELLTENRKAAKDEALNDFKRMQDELKQQELKEGEFIDSQLESIEEKYGVDFSKDKKLNNDFLDFMENISSKNEDGSIKDYANFDSSFQIFQQLRSSQNTNNRSIQQKKEIASRSITTSNNVTRTPAPSRVSFKDAEKYIDSLR